MEIYWEGTEELNARLKEMSKRYPRERDLFLRQEAELLKGRAKKLTPVDTGRLRGAWSSSQPAGGTVEVFNDVEYAGYVEGGHSIVAWGHDTGRVKEGVFMLRDAVEESRAQFVKDANNILARLFNG